MIRSSKHNCFKERMLHHMTAAAALILCCVSCESEKCRCPVPDPPVCPPPGQIQLSQLDAAARSRLKDEVRSELRSELRMQWRREFENEMRRNQKAADTVETAPEPDVPQILAIPEDYAEPLPPTQEIERDSGGLKILRVSLAAGVVKRQPVDERDVFRVSDGSIFCFTEISAPHEEERTITVRFTHSTGLSQSYTLPINQSPAWRTWSKLNLTRSMTGNWLCEIFNEDAALLASRPFTVIK